MASDIIFGVWLLLLLLGVIFEDKLFEFEQDCRAIYRACKRQHITFKMFLKTLKMYHDLKENTYEISGD